MFEKIPVAVGGPDASLEPARVAGRLAAALGGQLTIISVYPATSANLGEPYYLESLRPRIAEAQRTIDEARVIASAEGARQIETDALEGAPAERISMVADQLGFELIVMGTQRRGRLSVALLGSVSSAVAARAGIPVMVVPEPARGVSAE